MITNFVLDAPDTLIHASFHPGFIFDLTSWKIQITETGELTQVIRWDFDYQSEEVVNKPFSYRTRRDARTIQISPEKLTLLKQTIEELDLPGIQQVQEEFVFDDAETISIAIPSKNFKAEISIYTIDSFNAADSLSEVVTSGLRSFEKIWDLIESVAPYTTTAHYHMMPSLRDRSDPVQTKYQYMEDLIINTFFYCIFHIHILALMLIPLFGFYELGKTIWYLNYYEHKTGVVVGCHKREFDDSTQYSLVARTKQGARITAEWPCREADCINQLGKKVNVLINPENTQEGVMNDFTDRWLPASVLMSISTLIFFFVIKKKRTRDTHSA